MYSFPLASKQLKKPEKYTYRKLQPLFSLSYAWTNLAVQRKMCPNRGQWRIILSMQTFFFSWTMSGLSNPCETKTLRLIVFLRSTHGLKRRPGWTRQVLSLAYVPSLFRWGLSKKMLDISRREKCLSVTGVGGRIGGGDSAGFNWGKKKVAEIWNGRREQGRSSEDGEKLEMSRASERI